MGAVFELGAGLRLCSVVVLGASALSATGRRGGAGLSPPLGPCCSQWHRGDAVKVSLHYRTPFSMGMALLSLEPYTLI